MADQISKNIEDHLSQFEDYMHSVGMFCLSGESYRLRGKKKYLEGSIHSLEPELEMPDRQEKTD